MGFFKALLLSILAVVPIAHSASPPATKPVAVIVSEARVDRLVDRVEALGTLRANESVSVTANVTESVSSIHFDDGQRVEAGEILVEMTSAEEHALLEEARARVAEAERLATDS